MIKDLKGLPPEEIENLKKELVLKKLNSKEELQAWLHLFFDIHFPMGVVYPTSTHGPIDAMWEIYNLIKTGESADCPQVTMLASRDSYKTLSAASLEVLCMIHFRMPIAHMAAIKAQSAKCIQYVNSFFRKLGPYLAHHGWKKTSDNKTYIEWITDKEETIYLNIVTATLAGANSEHVPMLCVGGEVDIMCKNNTVTTRVRRNQKARLIYKNLLKGKEIQAYTFNHSTGMGEFKKITKAFKQKKELFCLTLSNGKELEVSADHPICTIDGTYKALKDFEVGEKILVLGKQHSQNKIDLKIRERTIYSVPNIDTNELEQLLLGSLLGDGGCYKVKNNNPYFAEQHGHKQLDYVMWKKEVLERHNFRVKAYLVTSGYTGKKNLTRIYTNNDSRLGKWCRFRKEFDYDIIKKLSPLGLAVWFMDDGASSRSLEFHTQSFNMKQQVMLQKVLKDNFNINVSISKRKNYKGGEDYHILHGSTEDKYKLYKICKDYIRPDLLYKFDNTIKYTIKRCVYCGDEFNVHETGNTTNYCNSIICRSVNYKQLHLIEISDIKSMGIQDVYDFTVKDNHNFYANQILVHNCIDEVDLIMDSRALKESKLIPSMYKGYYPLTVYLSTRKFAGGLMEKTLKETIDAGGEILRWNIVDVAERITHEEARVKEPKITRYLSRDLPMENLTPEQYEERPDEIKHKYEKVDLYAGIADHPLVPIMRNYLVDRPQEDTGDLYKPVVSVLNNFKQVADPDWAEAQLLCNKPSSSGLVYPRFDEIKNVISVNGLLKMILGDDCEIDNFEYLKDYINNLGIEVIGGGDWGYTDYTALGVFALLPGGVVVLLDTLCLQHLELGDIVKYGKEFQEKWNVSKWYVDQNYPSYLQTLRKGPKDDGTGGAGWKIPKFTKVVADGITGLQGKVVDSANKRRFLVLDTPGNKQVIDAFGEYRWALDGKGEVIEGKPYHDKEGVADLMDMIRYPAQNRFMKGKGTSFAVTGQDSAKSGKKSTVEEVQKLAKSANQQMMKDKIGELATGDGAVKKTKSKGRIFWA